jgi:hypothetical protein
MVIGPSPFRGRKRLCAPSPSLKAHRVIKRKPLNGDAQITTERHSSRDQVGPPQVIKEERGGYQQVANAQFDAQMDGDTFEVVDDKEFKPRPPEPNERVRYTPDYTPDDIDTYALRQAELGNTQPMEDIDRSPKTTYDFVNDHHSFEGTYQPGDEAGTHRVRLADGTEVLLGGDDSPGTLHLIDDKAILPGTPAKIRPTAAHADSWAPNAPPGAHGPMATVDIQNASTIRGVYQEDEMASPYLETSEDGRLDLDLPNQTYELVEDKTLSSLDTLSGGALRGAPRRKPRFLNQDAYANRVKALQAKWKSLPILVKGGVGPPEPKFTGVVKDRQGHTVCFREGKRVPCPRKQKEPAKRPGAKPEPGSWPGEQGRPEQATDPKSPQEFGQEGFLIRRDTPIENAAVECEWYVVEGVMRLYTWCQSPSLLALNKLLRNAGELDPSSLSQHARLQRAFQMTPTARAEVYRGVDLSYSAELSQQMLDQCNASIATGEPMTLTGYTPCTTRDDAQFFSKFRMCLTVGNALLSGPDEVLLNADTMIVVTQLVETEYGWDIIGEEVVQQLDENGEPVEEEGAPQEGAPPAGLPATKAFRVPPPGTDSHTYVLEQVGPENVNATLQENVDDMNDPKTPLGHWANRYRQTDSGRRHLRRRGYLETDEETLARNAPPEEKAVRIQRTGRTNNRGQKLPASYRIVGDNGGLRDAALTHQAARVYASRLTNNVIDETGSPDSPPDPDEQTGPVQPVLLAQELRELEQGKNYRIHTKSNRYPRVGDRVHADFPGAVAEVDDGVVESGPQPIAALENAIIVRTPTNGGYIVDPSELKDDAGVNYSKRMKSLRKKWKAWVPEVGTRVRHMRRGIGGVVTDHIRHTDGRPSLRVETDDENLTIRDYVEEFLPDEGPMPDPDQ